MPTSLPTRRGSEGDVASRVFGALIALAISGLVAWSIADRVQHNSPVSKVEGISSGSPSSGPSTPR